MNCVEFLREVEEGERGRELSPRAAAHARVCPSCRKFHAEQSALRKLVAELPPVYAPSNFDNRLRERLAAEPRPGGWLSRRLTFPPGNPALIFAASFALVFAVAVAVQQVRTSRVASAPAVASAGAVGEGGQVAASPKRTSTESATSSETLPSANVAPKQTERLKPVAARGTAEAARPFELRQRVVNDSTRQRSVSQDFVETAAPARVVLLEPEVRVQVSAPLAPARLLLNERDGTTRDVTLKPVTFGSQNFMPARKPADSGETRSW